MRAGQKEHKLYKGKMGKGRTFFSATGNMGKSEETTMEMQLSLVLERI